MTEEAIATPTPEAVAPDLSKNARLERAKALFRPKAPEANSAPVGEPAVASAAPSAAVEAPVPEQKQTETNAAYEVRLAQALQDAISKDRKTYELEQQLRAIQAERDAEKASREKLDPIQRAMLEGQSYEDVTRAIVEGKYAPKSKELQAVDAQSERIAKLEQELERRAARDAEEDQKRKYGEKRGTIAQKLAELKDKYAYVAELEWSPDAVTQRMMQSGDSEPDIDVVLAELNAAARKDVHRVAKNESALKDLVSDPDIKAALMKLLAPQPAAPTTPTQPQAPGAIPTRLSHETTYTQRTAGSTKDERLANAARVLREARKAAAR